MADLIDRQETKDHIDSRIGRIFNGCTIGEAMKIMLDEMPSADVQPHQLTEEDLIELRHRFGKDVECVVRDMISGKDERWQNG